MDFRTGLTVIDYVVIAVMFLIPLGIGILFAYIDRNKATREEYLVGGRKMSLLPITVSLFVTYQSAISIMGIPNEVYSYGPMFPVIYLGMSLSYIVGFFVMIPVMYPLRLTSLYEYLTLRYESQTIRILSTIIGMFQNLFYMAVALFSPALALQTAASIPLWMSVVIVGVIGTVYTAVGGIKSVVWTDAFQTLIVFFGIILVLVKGSLSVGSMADSWAIAKAEGRLAFNVVSPDPRTRHSFWGLLFGGMVMWMANVFNQSTIQRISAMRTKQAAGICFLLNIPLTILYGFLLFLVGIVMYAYFNHNQCDPVKGGLLTDGNQILPFYVLHVLRDLPGMAGFFMSTLFSGGLSTISSGMNALAANTVEDLLRVPLRGVREKRVTLFTKIFVIIYGIIIVGLAYTASSIQGPVTQMSTSVFGACGSPIFGMFLMGIMVPWANKYGALTGGIVAIVFNVFLAITGQLYGRKPVKLHPASIENCHLSLNSTIMMKNYTNEYSSFGSLFTNINGINNTDFTTTLQSNIVSTTHRQITAINQEGYGFFLFDISYEWYGVTGTFTCLIVGLIVSYLTRSLVKAPPKPELLSRFSRRWCQTPAPTSDKKIQLINFDNQIRL